MARFRDLEAVIAGERTNQGSGKIPTVTRILLNGASEPSATTAKFAWILKLPQGDLVKLKMAAEIAMASGVGIITLSRAKGGYELGLRPRISGDSSRHAVRIKMDGEFKPLREAVKTITVDAVALGSASRTTATTVRRTAGIGGQQPALV